MLTSQFINQYLESINAPKKILVAYSGGLDSHVLLHLISMLSNYDVRAMHVHHGLLSEADSWVTHCEETCLDLNISLQIKYLGLKIKKGESLEEVARIDRYKALKKSLEKDELLITAHHQNDQTETLLLQLFRGAGVNGLAAMPLYSSIEFHARPLLSVSRQSLEAYATEKQLKYIQDPSNQDNSFDRNYLRNKVLPLIRKRWSGLDKAINRSASIQAETKQVLDEVSELDLHSVLSENNTINLNKLASLSKARQKLLIRYWIKICGHLSPTEKKLKHIFNNVINAREDAQPFIAWGKSTNSCDKKTVSGAELRRFNNKLYLMSPLSEHDSSQVIVWDIKKPLEIKTLGITIDFQSLRIDRGLSKGVNPTVSVRFRQGGEKMLISQRGHHVSLKNLLHESKIPPWLRSRLPLVYIGEDLVKIIGIESYQGE